MRIAVDNQPILVKCVVSSGWVSLGREEGRERTISVAAAHLLINKRQYWSASYVCFAENMCFNLDLHWERMSDPRIASGISKTLHTYNPAQRGFIVHCIYFAAILNVT